MLRSRRTPTRHGKVLALAALLLPALCGIVGLILDVGALYAARRQAQNAADAAVRVIVLKKLAGDSDAVATTAAEEIVTIQHKLPDATVTVNTPPSAGAYSGNAGYSEVVVTVPVKTWFIQVVSGRTNPVAAARAVAGTETVAPKEIITTLDPNAVPGLTADGVTLSVSGRVWVNSQGAGLDENSASVNLGVAGPAAKVLNGGSVTADRFRVVGGVDTPASYSTATGGACLQASQLLASDPFLNLPTPTTANGVLAVYPDANGQNQGAPQNVSVTLTGESISLSPGIYASIEVLGGPGTVTFQPGIYVLRGGNGGMALNISTTATVTGTGVMFYNTGSNYDAATGGPDKNDGNASGTDTGATFGTITIDAANLTLSAPSGATDPFAGFLVYQRRWNTSAIAIKRNAAGDTITGSVYARWAKATVTGSGAFNSQFVVGSFAATGSSGTLTVTAPGTPGKAKVVYLVE